MREISTVNLHLSEGGYMAKSGSSDRVLISTVDQEELQRSRLNRRKTHLMRPIAIQWRAFFMRFIMHATWPHLERRSAIQRLQLNSNDSH